MKIYLIGYRCTGKTSIGKKLADELGLCFIDTDDNVQTKACMNIFDLIDKKGWAYFRQLEKECLKETLEIENCIISTGGGIILDKENRTYMNQTGLCIWLKAEVQTILTRLAQDPNTEELRPALSHHSLDDETVKILKERTPLYQEVQDITVQTDRLSINDCCQEIIRRIKDVRF